MCCITFVKLQLSNSLTRHLYSQALELISVTLLFSALSHYLIVPLFLHKSTCKMSTNDKDGTLDFLGCIISSFEALLNVTESLNKSPIIDSGDPGDVHEDEDDPYNEKYDNEDYVPSEEEDDEEYEEYEEYEDEDDLA
ncbi:uncharacterized protein B0P05DRAFT_597490 [Gilbertella persicaria]|uniref:uncharacterized protein n=1 Tax=Gilbertella persicaria TaxID=101096 RepID=UPI002220BB83|nr:uncharacterized protein B0P05DRAFT_597490 [Gilbertella persicaria]KAI8076375.1 hypothetical protein B0P05DRAFT_597490 [Gilbertella persicaria]